MDDRSVARMQPPVADRFRGRLGIVVLAPHADVAADHDLAERLAVARYFPSALVDHAQVARRDELDALPRLDPRALRRRLLAVLGPRFADGDEGRRLGQPVDL